MKNKKKVEIIKNSFKAGLLLFIIGLIGINFAITTSAEPINKTRISDLDVTNITEEANSALREHYAKLFGIVGPDAKFNNLATKDNIAVINVSIDGRDRRIITKLATGVILPKITDELLAAKIRVNNITILESIKNLGESIIATVGSYGERLFYSNSGSQPRYVDEGISRLNNGISNVSINPAIRDIINGYNVFLSAEGKTQGIYVSEKSQDYFVVKGLNKDSKVKFSWMLRGIKKDSSSKLESQFGKGLGTEIRAIINYENESSIIFINGLDKIFPLINDSDSELIDIGNVTTKETTNSTSPGITLITGNLVDEFGLETDLGSILGESTTVNDNEATVEEEIPAEVVLTENVTNETSEVNESVESIPGPLNQTEETAIEQQLNSLEFSLFSVDEEFIIENVATVTGLNLDNVRRLITFSYAEPTGFGDEEITVHGKVDGIENVNGSVIIKLG
jgi:hypothetical protein